MHVGRTAGSGGGENDAPRKVGSDERNLLRDEAADREAEKVDALEVQGVDECDGVMSHRLDVVRRAAGRRGDTNVVEGDDATAGRQVVDEGRVPVVEVAPEVLQQHEGDVAFADIAVGVVDLVAGGDVLVRGVDVSGARVSGRFRRRRRSRHLGCHRRDFPIDRRHAHRALVSFGGPGG